MHAHTLPRIGNEVPQEDRGEGVEPSDEGETFSSSEDISTSSNSDEESPSKARQKIRRTVSEPAMTRADDVMMMSPTRKSRARTFAEPSSTRIAEDLEKDDDGVWMKSEDVADVVPTESEVSQEDPAEPAMTECLVVESAETDVSKGGHFM